MARSIYDEQRNGRTYPDVSLGYESRYDGREITSEAEFDEVRILCSPDGWVIGKAWIYNNDVKVSQVPGRLVQSVLAQCEHFRYDRDDPEVDIVRQKIIRGECEVKFASVENPDTNPIYTQAELHHTHWLLDLLHPFQDDDKDLFFDHLTRHLEHTEAGEGQPQIFKIPGIWKDDSLPRELVFFKMGDTEQFRPDILFDGDLDAFIQAHEDAGWLLDPAPGYQNIYKYHIQIGIMSDGTPWCDPGLVLQEYGIKISWAHRVKHIAKAFKAWEDGLSEADLANEAITNKRVWFKTRIGYAFKLAVDVTTSISVIDRVFGAPTSRSISGHGSVMTWATDDIERLAKDGIALFNPDGALLESLLDEPTLSKIQTDNVTFGEGVQGSIDAADWSDYQVAQYNAALAYTG